MDIHAAVNRNQPQKTNTTARAMAQGSFHDMLAKKSQTLNPAKSIQAAEAALKDQKAQKKKVNDIESAHIEELQEEDLIDLAVQKIEKKLSTLAELERRGRGF